MKKISGIYQFVCIENKKLYIGSSFNCEARREKHLKDLRNKTHHSITFQRAFNKYGEEKFIWNVVEIIQQKETEGRKEFGRRLTKDREQFWLDKYQAQEYIRKENNNFRKLTYNICPTAGSSLGVKRSEEYRGKQSRRRKGKSLPHLRTQEVMEKARLGRVGFKHSDLFKKKISLLKKNNTNRRFSVYQIDYISLQIINKFHSCEEASLYHKQLPGFVSSCLKSNRVFNKTFFVSEKNYLSNNFTKPKRLVSICERKAIVQLTLEGEIVTEFNSIGQAIKKTGIKSINDSLKGRQSQSGGFRWRYKNDIHISPEFKSKLKAIVQLDLDDRFINKFSSIAEAKKRAVKGDIQSVLCGRQRTSNGFKWLYEKDYQSLRQVA